MPYYIKKTANGWAVINKESNEVKGYSKTQDLAKQSIQAIYANENKSLIDKLSKYIKKG